MKNKFNSNILLVDNGFIGKNKSSYYISGSTNDFINDLTKLGIDVDLFQFHKEIIGNENVLEAELKNQFISVRFNDNNFLLKIISYFKLGFKLLLNICKFDYIYVFYPGNLNYLVLFLSFLFNKKYGLYVRGELNYNLPFSKQILSNANLIVTNNPIIIKELLIYNHNSKMIISYKKLGNEIPILPNQFEKKSINLNSPFNLLFVGRVEVRKGVIELIDACKLLIKNKINFKLVIVGGGELYESIKENINSDLVLNSHIELVGLIKDPERMKSYYLNSDIFVFPSHTEGFPRVIFDSMLYNLPIITTMVGGIPGFMKHNYNCLEIKVNDPQDIYDKIMLFHNNENLINKLQLNNFDNLKHIFPKDLVLHKNLIKDTLDDIAKSNNNF
ncbi:glycosyltransferase family 4 protein [archaeon]|jgi:glycosyltransferase involved in cell wall biosynthesis|nr:glycosyltransferase family 4 protein [archaeon]